MFGKYTSIILLILLSVLFVKCGQRGSPTGGPKDTTPPVVLKSTPENNAIQFKGKRIELEFDEYVKVGAFYNEFVISPPIEGAPKYKLKGKKLILEFENEFQANTTYNLYFGKAIKDLNEGNALIQNQFVFSTGNYIDSLSFSGKIYDAKTMKSFDDGMVHLYKSFEDSVPAKEIPSYFAQVVKGEFQFSNLAEGDYKIFALNDINGNYLYDLPNEQIAYEQNIIHIGESVDSAVIKLMVFEAEKLNQFMVGYKNPNKNLIAVKFNNPVEKFSVALKGQSAKKDWFIQEWNEKRDSVVIWSTYTSELDSLEYEIEFDGESKLIKIPSGNKKLAVDLPLKFTHNLTNTSNYHKDTLKLSFNKPISSYDKSGFLLYNETDTIQPELVQGNSLGGVMVLTPLSPGKNYRLSVLPNAVQSIFKDGNKDTLNVSFSTAGEGVLSDLVFNYDFTSISNSGILEFWSGKEKKAVYYIQNGKGKLNLKGILPSKYKFKFIADADQNKRWSPGDYWQQKQPEKVYWYKEEVNVRANWEMEIDWVLIP